MASYPWVTFLGRGCFATVAAGRSRYATTTRLDVRLRRYGPVTRPQWTSGGGVVPHDAAQDLQGVLGVVAGDRGLTLGHVAGQRLADHVGAAPAVALGDLV